MRTIAIALLVGVGAGLPLLYAALLRYPGRAMFLDQLLRVRNAGETALTNPHSSTRRRYRKLYEDFTPNCLSWRLVLIARKLALAVVGTLLTGDPALQVWHRMGEGRCAMLLPPRIPALVRASGAAA